MNVYLSLIYSPLLFFLNLSLVSQGCLVILAFDCFYLLKICYSPQKDLRENYENTWCRDCGQNNLSKEGRCLDCRPSQLFQWLVCILVTMLNIGGLIISTLRDLK